MCGDYELRVFVALHYVMYEHEEAQLALWRQRRFWLVKQEQSVPAKLEVEQREEGFPVDALRRRLCTGRK